MGANPDALRADLQQYYGIDLDHAMAGEHTPEHVAALVAQLPAGARLLVAANPDNRWTFEAQLMAGVYNRLLDIAHVFQKQGAPPPAYIGPRSVLEAADGDGGEYTGEAYEVEELERLLSLPRR